MKFLLWFCSFFLFFSEAHAASSSFQFPQGQVNLVSSGTRLGLHFKMTPHWHIYWINSGDSGAAPKWTWTVENGKVTAEHWPVPARIPYEGMINLGYENETAFVFDIEPEKKDFPIDAKVKLEFLICKIECIPYFTELETKMNLQPSAAVQNIFDKFIYPVATPLGLKWEARERKGDTLKTRLSLPESLKEKVRNIEFFPFDGESFKPLMPSIDIHSTYYDVDFALQDTSKESFVGSRFLVLAETLEGQKQAFEATLEKHQGPALALVFLWALIGGLILNVMPCVFPVLSIKILSFLGPNNDERKLKASGLSYTVGVILSFLALGGTLLVLRAAGEKIGWGFQLQSPLIAAGIALLFFWLGMNFLGTYEIGQSLTYLGAKKTSSNLWGSFLTGVLATVVATPCTAPFMGAALGASLAMPTWNTLLIFFGLGLGMASPFLAIAFFPPLLKLLPRPGAWMQTLKEFLAFPLFATVLWLLWVLSHQSQVMTILFVLAVFLSVAFWIWFAQRMKSERTKQFFLMLGFILSFASLVSLPQEKLTAEVSTSAAFAWKEFTPEAVKEELKSGKAVFIDFTAAWCITCQVNKKLVLNTEEIQRLFKDNEVQLYKADWTDRNPVITQALAQYGRNSLPLYVYYKAGSQEPHLLPEILTPRIVKDLFNKEK